MSLISTVVGQIVVAAVGGAVVGSVLTSKAGSVPTPEKLDVAGSLQSYAADMAASAVSLIETEKKYITGLGETQRKNLGHTLFGKDAAALRKGLKDAEAMQIRAGEALEKNQGYTKNAFLQTNDGLLFLRGEKQTMLANYKASRPASPKTTWQAEIDSGLGRIDEANQRYREALLEGSSIRQQWIKANPNKGEGDWDQSPEKKSVDTALSNWKKATDGIKTDENNAIKTLRSQIDAAPTVASTPLEQGIEVLEAQINALTGIIDKPEQPLSDEQKAGLQDLRDEVEDIRWDEIQSGFVKSSEEAVRLADERVGLSQEALDSGDPGSVDLLIKASKMMTEASNWQNNAARVQDVNSLKALMPQVVQAYEAANPTTTNLLKESIAYSQAAKTRIKEDTRIPDAASDLFDLTYEPSIGRKALTTIAADVESRTKLETAEPSAMEILVGKTATERAEEGGPATGTYTEQQLKKLAEGTLDISRGAEIRGDEAIADKAKELLGVPPTVDTEAREDLSNVISKALGLPEGSEASDALEGAVNRLDPTITEALTKAGKETLTRGPRDVSATAGKMEEAGTALMDRAVRGPSEVQSDIVDQALRDINAGVRPASAIEDVLAKASQEGLATERRPEGDREQALTAAGLDMIRREAPSVSPVQQTMTDAAIRDMDAEARGASQVEQALGLSAMRGMDAQQRAASPEEAALQARISELIGGAGTLSPLERRQVEQEMLALQQRQGRSRDTGAAAAVTGRMAEARRADLGQDLGQASSLLGQQEALIQARIQEQLQRVGMAQQGAASYAELEAIRQNERLRQQEYGLKSAISVEETDRARLQQLIAERESGAGFLSEAQRFEEARVQEELQRRATAQQGATSAASMESARYEDLLRRQAQGREAGMTAEQITSLRTADELAAMKTGVGVTAEAENIRRQAEMDDLVRKQAAGEMLTGVQGTGLEEENLEQRRKIAQAEALRQEQAQEITSLGLAASTAEAMAMLSNQDFANSLRAYQEGRLAYGQLQQSASSLRAEERSDIQTSGTLTKSLADVEATKYNQGLTAESSVLAGAGMTNEMRRGREADYITGSATAADIYKTGEGLDYATSGERRADITTGTNLVSAEEALRGSVTDDYITNIAAYTGTQPDAASLILSRPASQTDALSASAQGAGLSGSTGFQVTDPNTGLNTAMMDIKNRAQADQAQAANRSNITAGFINAAGSVAGSAIVACWVAREVFGIQNPMWLLFRDWMLHTSPSWFRNTYIKYGSRFARFISNKPRIKSLIRKWMTKIVRKHYGI